MTWVGPSSGLDQQQGTWNRVDSNVFVCVQCKFFGLAAWVDLESHSLPLQSCLRDFTATL